MKRIMFVFALLAVGYSSYGQDKIFKKNGEVITARVEEIGLEEVKYYEWQMNGPLLSLAVDVLTKIELENGRVIEFKDPLMDPETYADQKKSALKVDFLSPLFESLNFSYERSIRPGRSFETTLGLIGVGFDTYDGDKSAGVHLGAGYKFLRTPDFYAARMKYAHVLKGGYVKPEVLLSIYHNEYTEYTVNGSQTWYEDDVMSGAFVLNLGKQVVYDDSFLIDYSFGIGYGFTSQKFNQGDYTYTWRANQYGFFLASDETPLVLRFNLKIGLML